MDTMEKAVATSEGVAANKLWWAKHITHNEKLNPTVISAERLAALQRTELLDTLPELEFDRVTRLACRLLGTEVALLSLVDTDRQFFKSSCGLPEPWASASDTYFALFLPTCSCLQEISCDRGCEDGAACC